jgi:hypothetical protein
MIYQGFRLMTGVFVDCISVPSSLAAASQRVVAGITLSAT